MNKLALLDVKFPFGNILRLVPEPRYQSSQEMCEGIKLFESSIDYQACFPIYMIRGDSIYAK